MLSVELTVHRGRSGTETATEPSLRRTGPYFQQRSPGRTTDVCTDYYAPTLWAYYNCDTSTIRLRFEYDTTSYEELCAFEQ